jgi:broad specificity phosphatase PhoE
MVIIFFATHATSVDNEHHLASGHRDVALSARGKQQARDLGKRFEQEAFTAIFCSDLQRSSTTGQIAFASRGIPLLQDARLRECDYGELTQHPSHEIEAEKANRIAEPFPHGESYQMVARRMKSFLQDVLKVYEGEKILIIGHRATQYALEHWINGIPLKECVLATWTWQPGWMYTLESM